MATVEALIRDSPMSIAELMQATGRTEAEVRDILIALLSSPDRRVLTIMGQDGRMLYALSQAKGGEHGA